MRKHTFLLLLSLWGASPLCAQEPKGAAPLTTHHSSLITHHSTRAVVIGISDYQDPAIPDLQFAHRDAEAFAAWLQSPAGGSVPAENIQVLLNEKATMGRVAMALWALMTQCVEGDQAIIYFSGHGDVETRTIAQPGYWLCWDSPPYAYMSGGCFNVRDLQDIVATLSLQNKARVLVISDACHAGKLAGSDIGGPQATAQNLARQFASEVKILSCQPNEFSLEGTQWGGGRGCFSYHLTDGLYGLADGNGDTEVNLLELENYLEERVPAETAPHPQLPFVVGNKTARLARVDAPTLARIKAGKTGAQPSLEPIDPRGMEDWVLARADSSVRELYAAFNAALERKELLEPKGTSADDYYRRLINEPELAPVHGLMTRNFAAALLDESQQVTNKLLRSDPYVVSDIISRTFVFDYIHTYIARAIELLGDRHFLYKHLKAKQLYFEAKTYRAENFPTWPLDSINMMYRTRLEEGLRFDSTAAYIYLETAIYYAFIAFKFDLAIQYGSQAIELSPNCAAAYFFVGNGYINLHYFNPDFHGDAPEAKPYLEKALALDSTFLPTYIFLGLCHAAMNNQKQYQYFLEKYIQRVQEMIQKNPGKVPVFYYCQLGNALWKLGRFEEAEAPLLTAEKLSNGQAHNAYYNLFLVSTYLRKWEKVIHYGIKLIEFAPDQAINYYEHLGFAYGQTGEFSKAEEVYDQWIRESEGDTFLLIYAYRFLGDLYLIQGRRTEADSLFKSIISYYPDPPNAMLLNFVGRAQYVLHGKEAMEQTILQYFQTYPDNWLANHQVACLYALAKQEQKALEWLEKALQGGMNDYIYIIQSDVDLDYLRDKKGFKTLLKKYFPERVKD